MGSFPETNNDLNVRRIYSQSHIELNMTSTKEWGLGERGNGKHCVCQLLFSYIMIPVSIGNSMV